MQTWDNPERSPLKQWLLAKVAEHGVGEPLSIRSSNPPRKSGPGPNGRPLEVPVAVGVRPEAAFAATWGDLRQVSHSGARHCTLRGPRLQFGTPAAAVTAR